MKVKCPHCQFKFDTTENLNPPFKIGQKVRFIKKYKRNFHYPVQLPFGGKIISYALIRAKDHLINKFKNRDVWLFTVSYVPYGTKNGCRSVEVPEFAIKKL